MKKRWSYLHNWLNLLLFDYGFLRVILSNFSKVTDNLYRSAQPIPYNFHKIRKAGIKTIFNLRGDIRLGEIIKKQCAKYGIKYVVMDTSAYELMSKEDLYCAKEIFETIEYPVMIHCKSGADRTGFMATLYMIFIKKKPFPDANQLKWRHGHIRHSKAGVLDAFFEAWLDFQKKADASFEQWIEHHYDKQAIEENFHKISSSKRMFNSLRRLLYSSPISS